MNNEQKELLDEVYKNYWRQTISNTEDSASLEELDGMCLSTGEIKKVYRQYAPKEFINKCKTDPEFSERWGLKIEERELSEGERGLLLQPLGLDPLTKEGRDRLWKENNLPTKKITITKITKIESYK